MTDLQDRIYTIKIIIPQTSYTTQFHTQKSTTTNIHKFQPPSRSSMLNFLEVSCYKLMKVNIYIYIYIYIYIQGVSRLVDITAGGDFLGLCDKKSPYKHVSDFGRLLS